MSAFLERLRHGRYQSPSGRTFEFECDEVRRTSGKKTSEHDYPLYNGGDIADLGITIPTYPMTIYFIGPDFDLEGDAFWRALWEEGEASLEHPRWGNLTVVPVDFEQSEALVKGMGRSLFSVTFKEVNSPLVAESEEGVKAELIDSNEKARALLPGSLLDMTIDGLSSFKRKVLSPLNFINGHIAKFYDVAGEFNSLFTAFEIAFNGLLNSPQSFVDALYSIYNVPSKSILRMGDRLTLYNQTLLSSSEQDSITTAEAKALYLSSYINALCLANTVLSGSFFDRREAITSVQTIAQSYQCYSSQVSLIDAQILNITDAAMELALKGVITSAAKAILFNIDALKRLGTKTLSVGLSPKK